MQQDEKIRLGLDKNKKIKNPLRKIKAQTKPKAKANPKTEPKVKAKSKAKSKTQAEPKVEPANEYYNRWQAAVRSGKPHSEGPGWQTRIAKLHEAGQFWQKVLEMYGFNKDKVVLDIGCGNGMLPQHMLLTYPEIHYRGLDVNLQAIDFCREYCSGKNITFDHIDIENKYYGNIPSLHGLEKAPFPYLDSSCDFVILLSVFTHMYFEDIDHYIKEIHRVLKPGGVCIATFYLCDDSTKFRDPVPGTDWPCFARWKSKYDPLAHIGFRKGDIRKLHASHNMIITDEFFNGSRHGAAGTCRRLSGMQDCIVSKKGNIDETSS